MHDLVHTGGYKVILIHNRQARPELCKNASSALSFEDIVIGKHTGNPTGGEKKPANRANRGLRRAPTRLEQKDGDRPQSVTRSFEGHQQDANRRQSKDEPQRWSAEGLATAAISGAADGERA